MDDFTLRPFPLSTMTPAERLDLVMDLLSPTDPETGEPLPPMIDEATARRLLEMPSK